MTRAACTADSQELLAYWLGELDAARELALDEHLFACADCSERLRKLVDLGAAIRAETLRGGFGFVASAALVERLKASGLQLREYTLAPGGSVSCTIAPTDDFVVSHLQAPLSGVRRLDLLVDDDTVGKFRLSDVVFDPAGGGLTMVPSSAFLRTLRFSQQRVQLVAVDGVEERVIADYTFNHSPS